MVDKDYRGEVVSQRTNCMAFTADGKMIAAGVEDKSVRIWDVDQGRMLLKFDNVEANGVAFSPDGSKIAAASHDNIVKVFRTASPNDPQLFTGHDQFGPLCGLHARRRHRRNRQFRSLRTALGDRGQLRKL